MVLSGLGINTKKNIFFEGFMHHFNQLITINSLYTYNSFPSRQVDYHFSNNEKGLKKNACIHTYIHNIMSR